MTDQPNKTRPSSNEDVFGKAKFSIEHALGLYASSICTMPAETIYDKDALAPLMSVIESCHIYFIGYTPEFQLIDAQQVDRRINLKYTVLGNEYTVQYDLPEGFSLILDGETYFVENASGARRWLSEEDTQIWLSAESNAINFDVKYVGQAFGQDGSRNAIDRLLKHETLQKIAVKGVPGGYRITLLLLEVKPSNQLFTLINPFAKNKDDRDSRIKSGLDKLFNTTEQERIALYEAAFIRYFYPQFNKEFKDSFPSTNLKILQDCYEKDFGAIVAEICIDNLPFKLKSNNVEPTIYHIAKYDLHKDDDRKMFFGF